jgi:hypothetical protein
MNVWNNLYQSAKKKQKTYVGNNIIESAKNIGGDVVQQVNTELIGGVAKNFAEQIGLAPKSSSQTSGEIDFSNLGASNHGEIAVAKAPVRAGIQHESNIITETQILVQKENAQTQNEIRQILGELKQLALSVKSFESEVAKVAMEPPPVRAGIYHKNFFEWLSHMIRDMRKKVNESSTWLRVFQTKKQKRGYWQMFKKHGTSFAMSDERGIATSTG